MQSETYNLTKLTIIHSLVVICIDNLKTKTLALQLLIFAEIFRINTDIYYSGLLLKSWKGR